MIAVKWLTCTYLHICVVFLSAFSPCTSLGGPRPSTIHSTGSRRAHRTRAPIRLWSRMSTESSTRSPGHLTVAELGRPSRGRGRRRVCAAARQGTVEGGGRDAACSGAARGPRRHPVSWGSTIERSSSCPAPPQLDPPLMTSAGRYRSSWGTDRLGGGGDAGRPTPRPPPAAWRGRPG